MNCTAGYAKIRNRFDSQKAEKKSDLKGGKYMKKNRIRKILAWIGMLALMVGMVPSFAYAQEENGLTDPEMKVEAGIKESKEAQIEQKKGETETGEIEEGEAEPGEKEEGEEESGEKEEEDEGENENRISYKGHAQTFGDLAEVQDGAMLGSVGKAKRLEALEIQKGADLQDVDGEIMYRVHVQTYGNQSWRSTGELAGTTGKAKRVEALQMYLTGELAEQYDIYYALHCQTYGWTRWVKGSREDSSWCGTAGFAKRVEGIRIVLVKKEGESLPEEPGAFSYVTQTERNGLCYRGHQQTYGNLSEASNGTTLGIIGHAKRLEALQIEVRNVPYDGSVTYRAHVQTYGWQDWVSDGETAGTTGQAKRLEAIEIKLTGELAEHYDVWYRVHIQSYGWLGWAKNGQTAGSSGIGYRMEALQIKLIPKNAEAPGTNAGYYKDQAIKKLVVIDAGHQRHANRGKEPVAPGSSTLKMKVTDGTYGIRTKTPEYQVVLDVAFRLQRELEAKGYKVIMIRTSHDVNISNVERANIANAYKADAFIRLHCNGSTNQSQRGAMTICMTPSNPYCGNLYAASRSLSQQVLNHMCAKSGAVAEKVWETDTMTGINWSKVPVTIVEMGYLTNPSEEQLLINSNYQKLLASGIADGVAAFLK